MPQIWHIAGRIPAGMDPLLVVDPDDMKEVIMHCTATARTPATDKFTIGRCGPWTVFAVVPSYGRGFYDAVLHPSRLRFEIGPEELTTAPIPAVFLLIEEIQLIHPYSTVQQRWRVTESRLPIERLVHNHMTLVVRWHYKMLVAYEYLCDMLRAELREAEEMDT